MRCNTAEQAKLFKPTKKKTESCGGQHMLQSTSVWHTPSLLLLPDLTAHGVDLDAYQETTLVSCLTVNTVAIETAAGTH